MGRAVRAGARGGHRHGSRSNCPRPATADRRTRVWNSHCAFVFVQTPSNISPFRVQAPGCPVEVKGSLSTCTRRSGRLTSPTYGRSLAFHFLAYSFRFELSSTVDSFQGLTLPHPRERATTVVNSGRRVASSLSVFPLFDYGVTFVLVQGDSAFLAMTLHETSRHVQRIKSYACNTFRGFEQVGTQRIAVKVRGVPILTRAGRSRLPRS